VRVDFYNNEEDVEWLSTTHLKGLETIPFKSFVLTGNEDCPTIIELYKDQDPLFSAKPDELWVLDNDSNTYSKKG